MWSPWIFGHSGGVADELENREKKTNSKRKSNVNEKSATNRSELPVREEMVQSAINFLSHPNVREAIEIHIPFLLRKGLTMNEVQESLNRLHLDESDSMINYDPLNVLPPTCYEEFLYQIEQPDAIAVLSSFNSFVNSFEKGMLDIYTDEDKGKIVGNQIQLLTHEVTALYKAQKVKVSQIVIGECVEKYLLTRLYHQLFTPKKSNDDSHLFHKISLLKNFITAENLDIPSKYVDSTLWSVAQQGFIFQRKKIENN